MDGDVVEAGHVERSGGLLGVFGAVGEGEGVEVLFGDVGVMLVGLNETEPLGFTWRDAVLVVDRDAEGVDRVLAVQAGPVEPILVLDVLLVLHSHHKLDYGVVEGQLDIDGRVGRSAATRDTDTTVVLVLGDDVLVRAVVNLNTLLLSQVVHIGKRADLKAVVRNLTVRVNVVRTRAVRTNPAVIQIAGLQHQSHVRVVDG